MSNKGIVRPSWFGYTLYAQPTKGKTNPTIIIYNRTSLYKCCTKYYCMKYLLWIIDGIFVILEDTILVLRWNQLTAWYLNIILPDKMFFLVGFLPSKSFYSDFLLFQCPSILHHKADSQINYKLTFECVYNNVFATSGGLGNSLISSPSEATAKTKKLSGLSTAVKPYLAASAAASVQTMALPNWRCILTVRANVKLKDSS